MAGVGIVVTLKIQEGKNEEFENVFKDLQSKVKANEPDCLVYDFFKSRSDAQTYVIQEQYASQEALDAHGKTEYFAAAQPGLGATLAGAPTIELMDKVE